MGGRDGCSFDAVWSREKNLLIWRMYWSLHPAERAFPRWLRLLERVGRWSSVLKRAKERSAWITMKSDRGRDGIVTSPCVCSLTPFSWSCEPRARRRCPKQGKTRKKNAGDP